VIQIKYTNQRLEILNFFKDNESHFSVETVYDSVKQKLSRISKATVYRNLEYLAQKGFLNQLIVNGILMYELKKGEHHHLICSNCQSIIDFESDELTLFSLDVAKKNFTSFEINAVTITFHGICKECQKEKKHTKLSDKMALEKM